MGTIYLQPGTFSESESDVHTTRYRITDDATIDAFIRANGFATLVTTGSDGIMATHVPIELARPRATPTVPGPSP